MDKRPIWNPAERTAPCPQPCRPAHIPYKSAGGSDSPVQYGLRPSAPYKVPGNVPAVPSAGPSLPRRCKGPLSPPCRPHSTLRGGASCFPGFPPPGSGQSLRPAEKPLPPSAAGHHLPSGKPSDRSPPPAASAVPQEPPGRPVPPRASHSRPSAQSPAPVWPKAVLPPRK